MAEYLTVDGKSYETVRLLGHGKGGYSYLGNCEGNQVVIKKIHHEPCDYYTFGNKIEAELNDYQRLKKAGIRIPEMIGFDREQEIIIKQYIEGETAFDLVRRNISTQPYLSQLREMADLAYKAGLNIDYFPTNFIVSDGILWYIDYECNEYMDQWNLENWGIRYWSKTEEFEEYMNSMRGSY